LTKPPRAGAITGSCEGPQLSGGGCPSVANSPLSRDWGQQRLVYRRAPSRGAPRDADVQPAPGSLLKTFVTSPRTQPWGGISVTSGPLSNPSSSPELRPPPGTGILKTGLDGFDIWIFPDIVWSTNGPTAHAEKCEETVQPYTRRSPETVQPYTLS
jgi:hypothetical protein